MLLAIFFILQRYSFFDLNPPDWVASPAKVMNLVMNCQEEKSPVFYFPKFDDLVKSLEIRFSVILADPGSGPGQAPESRVFEWL